VKTIRLHLFVVFGFAALLFTSIPLTLSNAITDLRFGWITRPATGSVVVVAIDPRSLDAVGIWPWPRHLHAELIERLQRAGATDIAFDVDFSSSSDKTSDEAFAAGLAAAGGSVVLPIFKQIGRGTDAGALHITQPTKQLRDSAWLALVNVATDRDSRIRTYPLGDVIQGQFVPSLGALLSGRIDPSGSPFLVDFGIEIGSVPVVSYVDVLKGDAAALGAIAGKKAIIGGTAVELGDRFSVPRYGIISGPMLQALATESLIQDRVLRSTSSVASLAFVAAIVVLMMLIWKKQSAGGRILLLSALVLASELAAFSVQLYAPIVLDTSLVLIIIALYTLACALDEIDLRGLMRVVAERRFQRMAMSLGDGVICANHQRIVTFWNPAATTIFGYTEAEMSGRSADILFEVDAIQSLAEAFPAERTTYAGGRTIEIQAVRSTGERFPLEMCISMWSGADGTQYGAVVRDITERKREEQRIRFLAENDPLTGLPNRNAVLECLNALNARARPNAAVLCLSIDNHGQIVDIRGGDYGDAVLRVFASRLTEVFGTAGFVARLGNEEFAIVVPEFTRGAENKFAADWASALGGMPLEVEGRSERVKISIGAIRIEQGRRSAEELLANAHLALYRAKSITGRHFMLYSDRIREQIETRASLEMELKQAIAAGEFELFYQPQLRMVDGELVGAEALIRWRHPRRGLVSPAEFMPVVNTSSMARDVADWVLSTACAQAHKWEQAGCSIRVSINLSPVQFAGNDLSAQVARVVSALSLSPRLLELEVTEDILLEDMTTTIATVEAIRALGVRVVFDDFGTGFASLSYLRRLPVDGLKLDRSFVAGMRTSSADASIVASMISLARQLDMSVVAEGIEDESTAELLRRLGCDEGQGYYFGKPVPADEFNFWVSHRQVRPAAN
jgi:diguanylate cyclase (GGDEF)-like protein/PAS domain S-box-containing protein